MKRTWYVVFTYDTNAHGQATRRFRAKYEGKNAKQKAIKRAEKIAVYPLAVSEDYAPQIFKVEIVKVIETAIKTYKYK